jgi:hypothetical protein
LPTPGDGAAVLINALSMMLVLGVPTKDIDHVLAKTIEFLNHTVEHHKQKKVLMDAGGTAH